MILIPLLYGLIARDEKRRMSYFKKFAQEKMWARIAPDLDPKARLRKSRYWLLGITFIFLALARPQWGTHEEVVQASGLDVVIALDLSNSMETEDVVPSRLQKAKHLIRSLVDKLQGDRVGVVGFAASSYVACPLTTDLGYVLQTAEILNPHMIQNQGTDIGIGLDTALKALDRGAVENTPGDVGKVLPSRVIILISDGEDHEEHTLESAKKIKDAGAKLYVLGIGTQKGGPIPVKDDSGNRVGFKKDRQGQPVVSEFHPNDLLEIAAGAGGRYWTTTLGEDEVNEIASDMGSMTRTDFAERRYLVFEDRFQYPLVLGLFFLFLELFIPARKIRNTAALLFFALQLFHVSAQASPIGSIDTYESNEQGLKLYQQKKFEEAQKQFGEAQARDPGKPELDFNQGVAQLQQGNAEAASESFKNSAREAVAKNNPELVGKSLYNLGGALTKKGDLKAAARAYLSSISIAVKSKNPELEAQARKNLELLTQEKKKQEQQKQDQKQQKQKEDQKDQKQKKDGDGKPDQKDQKKDPDSNPDQNKDKNKDENQDKKKPNEKYQDNSRNQRQFKSKKFSDQDAERVINELEEHEKQLQNNLKKRHAQSQTTEKDW